MEIWRRQRYERILVDFLFRTRCFETAQALAKATGIEVRFANHLFFLCLSLSLQLFKIHLSFSKDSFCSENMSRSRLFQGRI